MSKEINIFVVIKHVFYPLHKNFIILFKESCTMSRILNIIQVKG